MAGCGKSTGNDSGSFRDSKLSALTWSLRNLSVRLAFGMDAGGFVWTCVSLIAALSGSDVLSMGS